MATYEYGIIGYKLTDTYESLEQSLLAEIEKAGHLPIVIDRPKLGFGGLSVWALAVGD